ncbi:G5 domain-containing protein [Helcococcus kunzii]|uniref:G5 domain-containing protein n=1 Tax=Helcococcus kunzii TaxID=40091 RepID=UPI0021A6FFC3|nr:G5 domain-containing protein [Helcococcus kunzii]MCT1795734.1 G5 domain-containing protein [Helcococcus kunzii]MCT1989585.1 G5 domain-containing protein [Helcococcus kunzii]
MNFIKKNIKVLASTLVLVSVVSVGGYVIASLPKTVKMTINGEKKQIETSAKTVEELLNEQGYKVSDVKIENLKLEDKVVNNLELDFNTKKNIIFSNEGKELSVSTYTNNISEFLKENDVNPDEDDVVSPSSETKLNDNTHITYNNVVIENYKTKEKIAFKKTQKYDFNLNVGTNKVSVKGVNGEKEHSHEKVTVNGKVVSDKVKDTKITKKPVNQVSLIGSKQVVNESLYFDVIEKDNSSMYVGESSTVQKGHEGLKRYIYKVEGDKKELVSEKVISEPVNKIVENGTKRKAVVASSSSIYSLRDLRFQGVINWGGKRFTYYSQSVLPGGGLRIPGRHINAGGFVADSDGYIVLANDGPLGSVVSTPFGYMGKIYDRGTYGNHYDVYTR